MNFQGFSVDPVQIAASATTYLTATNVRMRLDKVTLTNPTGSDRIVTIYKIQSGGSAGNTTTNAYQKSVLAGQTVDVEELMGHWLEPSGFVQALCDSASAVSLMISGVKFPK